MVAGTTWTVSQALYFTRLYFHPVCICVLWIVSTFLVRGLTTRYSVNHNWSMSLICVAKLWLPLLVNGDLPSMFLAWERRITPTQITNWNSSLENPPTPKNCHDGQSFFFSLGIGLVASFAHVIELIVELEIGACVPQWLLKCFRIIFFL